MVIQLIKNKNKNEAIATPNIDKENKLNDIISNISVKNSMKKIMKYRNPIKIYFKKWKELFTLEDKEVIENKIKKIVLPKENVIIEKDNVKSEDNKDNKLISFTRRPLREKKNRNKKRKEKLIQLINKILINHNNKYILKKYFSIWKMPNEAINETVVNNIINKKIISLTIIKGGEENKLNIDTIENINKYNNIKSDLDKNQNYKENINNLDEINNDKIISTSENKDEKKYEKINTNLKKDTILEMEPEKYNEKEKIISSEITDPLKLINEEELLNIDKSKILNENQKEKSSNEEKIEKKIINKIINQNFKKKGEEEKLNVKNLNIKEIGDEELINEESKYNENPEISEIKDLKNKNEKPQIPNTENDIQEKLKPILKNEISQVIDRNNILISEKIISVEKENEDNQINSKNNEEIKKENIIDNEINLIKENPEIFDNMAIPNEEIKSKNIKDDKKVDEGINEQNKEMTDINQDNIKKDNVNENESNLILKEKIDNEENIMNIINNKIKGTENEKTINENNNLKFYEQKSETANNNLEMINI